MNNITLQFNHLTKQLVELAYIRYRTVCEDHNISPMGLDDYCVSKLISTLAEEQDILEKLMEDLP